MKDSKFLARLRYAFDKSMAAGTIALIGWLSVLSLLTITFAAAFIAAIGITPADDDDMDFFEAFWASLMRTLDPGTMGGDQGWSFRFVMLAVTMAGIFIVSTLIGVISTGLANRLELLRKGRSLVLEKDHTIIFNWSETIFDVIAQLVVANESRRRPTIVIMADRDKAAMEDEIAAKVTGLKNTRVVCRSGDPTDYFDIGIVNPQDCRSIIILSPPAAEADACVIKTILSLVTDPSRRKEPYRIAAEIRKRANIDVARAVGGQEVQLVLADDLISNIIVRSMRQPGLSTVYTELLDFEGCEIYAVEQPELVGKTFTEALMCYEACCPVGLAGEAGQVTLNPPMKTVIKVGQKLLIIAEDDDCIRLSSPPKLTKTRRARRREQAPETADRTLLIGWNRRARQILQELAHFVAPGSLITVAANNQLVERAISQVELGRPDVSVEFKLADTIRRDALEALAPTSYNDVLILGYSDELGPQVADTMTLITLLHVRALREGREGMTEVVSEINDVRNVKLAELAQVDDFVVSNKLVSLILTQASESEYFEQIFEDLLNEEGSEIALRPASDYVPLGEEVTFYDVVAAACASSETAIGHFRPSEDKADRRGGVIIDPVKSDSVRYGEADRIIVLAGDWR